MSAADKRLAADDLSADQREVYEEMLSWSTSPHSFSSAPGGASDGELGFRDSQVTSPLLTIGGFAGVGKSSLLGVFAAETDLLVAYVSFTGRAASILQCKLSACGVSTTSGLRPPDEMSRLRRKVGRTSGLLDYFDFDVSANGGPGFCGTLHQLLYIPIIDMETEELKGWKKRTRLDRDYDLIVIDEASMVGNSMLDDLRMHGVPIMAVGDHGQLPPVADGGDLMKNPMLRLEKIHRQAEGSPIIQLSKVIRETGRLDKKLADGERVSFRRRADVEDVLREAYSRRLQLDGPSKIDSPIDVGVLCWTNKMRVRLNGMARKALGFSGAPKCGEVVICLKNAPPIYNGMRGVLTEDGVVDRWLLSAGIDFPDEGISQDVVMCGANFNRERPFSSVDELEARGIPRSFARAGALYDFGYALTVHRSQGSQFEHVIFYVDRSADENDDMWRRLAYTAVTRASERLTILL